MSHTYYIMRHSRKRSSNSNGTSLSHLITRAEGRTKFLLGFIAHGNLCFFSQRLEIFFFFLKCLVLG